MLLHYFAPINQKNPQRTDSPPLKHGKKRKPDEFEAPPLNTTQFENGNCEGFETEREKIEPVIETAITDLEKETDRETDARDPSAVPRHLTLESETMAADWFNAFLKEMEKPYFVKIKNYLKEEYGSKRTVYPASNDIYTFTRCPLRNIRVVILGQDPYHGPGQAHGLCFSVKKGVPPPPSLVNIFKELENDMGPENFKKPNHGHLERWTEQGVLLLNTALTVRGGQAASHSSIGWAIFTDAVIAYVDKSLQKVVFMLWGGHAQKKGARIDKEKHLVLKSAHPSPLSAYRGFFQCKHFSKANRYLTEHNMDPIDWGRL